MPFVTSVYSKDYIIPVYIGESLAAFTPSVLALIQGIGNEKDCMNITLGDNSTILVQRPLKPNYSVGVYFGFMFMILATSTLSFTLLNKTKVAKSCRKATTSPDSMGEQQNEEEEEASKPINDASLELKRQQKQQQHQQQGKSIAELMLSGGSQRTELTIIYAITFFVSFICYGILPSLYTFSTIPYSLNVYYLSVNLSKCHLF